MPTIMFDAKGLLEGRRLRRLSTKTRLYYPIYSAGSGLEISLQTFRRRHP